jgi:tetratricopeptide (TPR) repeat protein
MVAQKQILRIVVVSSSDVQDELDVLEEVVNELNHSLAGEDSPFLEVYHWETDAYPGFHLEGPQGIIDSVLHIEDCDLLIGIFWKRLGPPVLDANSGPEHEFQIAYESWQRTGRPQIMIYFNQQAYSPKSKAELDEWSRVLEFQEKFPKEGMKWPYKGKSEFGKLVRKHLPKQIQKLKGESIDSSQKQRKTSDKTQGSELALFTPVPPMTDSRTIHQRRRTVEDIYNKLTQSDITGIILTGIGGLGKSTLAALVYRFVEERRQAYKELFTAEAIWLTINHAVSLADLGDALLEALNKPLPGFRDLHPQQQAAVLFDVLNMVDKPRLIVLDQFDNLLNLQTGRALMDCPGIGEWIDALNSNPCKCRIILISRILSQGSSEYPPTCLREYRVKGLEIEEGIELLARQGVEGNQANEKEMHRAVLECEGHALSLTLLATILRGNRSLRLVDLFNDPRYTQRLTDDIARRLLDYIYHKQLDQVQDKLLSAFSVYREPVPLDTALYLTTEPLKTQIVPALEGLIAQHLLQDVGEGRYRLHAIISSYARNHFVEDDEQANQQALQKAHARAAEYYVHLMTKNYISRENRRGIKDVQLLIEATWQYCQAGKLQDAYALMEKEGLFYDLKLWGESATLLTLCQLLLPLGKRHQELLQAAVIYSNLGWTYSLLGQKEQAIKYCEQALRIFQELEKRAGEGMMLNYLGDIYVDLGQHNKALEHYKQALHIFEELEDAEGKSRTLNSLGGVYDSLGQKENDLERREMALTYYQRALQEIGEEDHNAKAIILNNIGTIYKAMDKNDEALKQYQQALHLQEKIGDRNGQGITLNNLGMLYSAEGKRKVTERKKALEFYARALHLHKDIGDRNGEGVTLHNIGVLYFNQRRYRIALAYFLLARRILEEVRSPDYESIQEYIDKIGTIVGKEVFDSLVKDIQSRAPQIVEQSILEDLK